MIEGQIGNPPESYLKTILPLIEVARGLLEKGETLAPIAFVGNFATGKTAQVLLESGNDAEKDRSALAIRLAADMLEADFVFSIMEAWSLRKDKMRADGCDPGQVRIRLARARIVSMWCRSDWKRATVCGCPSARSSRRGFPRRSEPSARQRSSISRKSPVVSPTS